MLSRDKEGAQLSTEKKDDELRLLAEVLPGISAQLRGSLATLNMAFARIAPPERRAEDAELDRNAAILQQSYYRLLRLAGNLTCAARLLENAPLPLQNYEVTALLREIYNECRPLAEQTGHTLVLHNAPAPIITALHRESVQRVLLHLLSNAMKFSPRGSEIALRCHTSGRQVLLTVQDQGGGIPQEKLDYLLSTPLVHCRPEATPHGLGLGLPLARALAEGLGGSLLLESTPTGTAVTLALPLRQTAAVARDIPFQYSGGFSAALTELSDAMPYRAFLLGQGDKA